ncbi:MAG: trehalose-phosphatase [Gammaproteobacteria bacterium]
MPASAPQNLPDDPAQLALFLDVDGTLLPLAATPADVRVEPSTTALLTRLNKLLGGTLALVSGRTIANLDELFAPQRFIAAGQHGAEWRDGAGHTQQLRAHLEELEELRARLQRLAAQDPRLLVEDKGLSLALHYRRVPERAEELAGSLQAAVAGYPALSLQRGKYVLEIRPASCGKDTAIRYLLGTPEFAGRTPIFAGDDATDENAFRLVNTLGGLSIKVGAGASNARYRLADPTALRVWLAELAQPSVQITVLS